jgi:hypothetical protein
MLMNLLQMNSLIIPITLKIRQYDRLGSEVDWKFRAAFSNEVAHGTAELADGNLIKACSSGGDEHKSR